eukprot:Awhi_evm1s12382
MHGDDLTDDMMLSNFQLQDQLITEFTNLALEIKSNKKRSSNDRNPSDSSAAT